jgi:hypothetical protein
VQRPVDDRDARRVVAAILEARQALDQDGDYVSSRDRADGFFDVGAKFV